MFRLFLVILASCLAAAPARGQFVPAPAPPPTAAVQPPAAIQTPEQALAQDAAEYARLHDLGSDEAERRMRAQAESAAATDALRRDYADRVAGIAIVHRPDFHIRVLLTGDEPVPGRVITAGGMAVPVLFQTGARANAAQLAAAIARHRSGIDALVSHDGVGVDQRTGELVVVAGQEDLGGRTIAAISAQLTALTGVPVRIRLHPHATALDSGVTGGRRVEGLEPSDGRRYFCTTGFVVTDGRRTGIVTAAHCPDSLGYADPSGRQVALEFVGGWGAQFQDVQVHVGPTAQRPVFRAADADRPLLGRRLRPATRAGEIVCHRGEASGYSCAEVDLTDFAPPGLLCGGLCHPTWTSVVGPQCRSGDSGGPVFAGTVAFGIVKGSNYAADGRCNFYFYMSTDYLPPGWSLLFADAGAGAPPLPAPD